MKKILIFSILLILLGSSIAYILGNINIEDKQEEKVLGITQVLPTEAAREEVDSDDLEVINLEIMNNEENITPTIIEKIEEEDTKTTKTSDSIDIATPRVISSNSGTVTDIKYEELLANKVYKIDLSEFDQQQMVIAWTKDIPLKWATNETEQLSEFTDVPEDHDESEDEKETFSGILLKPSSNLLYIYSEKEVPQLRIALLDPKENLAPTISVQGRGIINPDAGASYLSLWITTRDAWGADPGTWDSHSSADIDDESRLVWLPVYYKTARIVIHHTATSPNSSDPAAAVRSVYLYHAYVRGWGDIGYNYLIDQYGRIYEGKLGGDGTLGYHAFGAANQISIGISLIGDFTYSDPTSATQDSLVRLLAERSVYYDFNLKYSDGSKTNWKDPSFTVFGHRDSYKWNYDNEYWEINATACPGNAFYPDLPRIVREANTYKENNFAELKAVVAEVEEAFEKPHAQGIIIVEYDVPEETAPEIIESYLPKYSGITIYQIEGNRVTIPIVSTTITHPTEELEYLLPPMGFTGYGNEFLTFNPSFQMDGPEDRAKILLKYFKLDPRVKAADVQNFFETQD